MATVTKDFRIKSGLIVEGANGTIDGSDIITEDAITGGTQTNVSVTYDAVNKVINFVSENGVGDSTTDDLAEGTTNLYFTDERAQDAVGAMVSGNTESGISVTYDDNTNKLNFNVNDPTITISGDVDGNAVMTNLGDTNISVTLDTVNTTTGSFGGQTKIPTFTVNGKGLVTASGEVDVATNLSIAGDTGTDTVSLLTDTLNILGGEGIDVAVTNNTITVSGEDATTSNKGVASFDTNNFSVTSGQVSAKTATLGSSTITLGSTTSSIAGLEALSVDNITINGNQISSTDTNGEISLNPNGAGHVNVNSSRVTNVATPEDSTDAATKAYVDSVAEGLHIHASAVAATTADLDIATDLMVGDIVDGVTLAATNRVLVKSQADAAENGIYVVQSSGAATRALDFDSPLEVDGGDFIFVTGGNTYADTGWVQTSDTVATVGVDPIQFTQFSGAGTYLAGTNLELDGNTFSLQDSITLSTVTADLTGDVTGNVLGDLTGNVTGNVTGDVTGNLTGNVTGNLTGDVTGDVTGDLTGNVTGQVSDISNHDTGDLTEGSNLYFTDERAYDAVNDSSTINFVEVELNSIAKQVASTYTTASGDNVVYAFSDAYRSGKFLVKLARGTHTEVSEILVTLDTSDNIAITEYAIVGTNGSLGTISAAYDGIGENVQITVNTPSATTVKVVGTIIE